MSFLRTLRYCSLAFILGAGLGGKIVYDYMNYQQSHIMSLALKGNCAQPDIDGQPFWFQCADYFIATRIQQEAVDEDQKNAIADAQSAAVFSSLKKNTNNKKVIK